MARVKRGVTAHAKHKKVYKAAKGFRGRRKNTIRTAKPAVEKALVYAFRDRKRKKRTFRALWIQRINAAVRPFGLTYSRFIDGNGQVRDHRGPQGAVGSRDQRARVVPGDRREGQGRSGGLS
ncbi:ribosomal protein L20 [Bradyrhizobium sp. GM6.1]